MKRYIFLIVYLIEICLVVCGTSNVVSFIKSNNELIEFQNKLIQNYRSDIEYTNTKNEVINRQIAYLIESKAINKSPFIGGGLIFVAFLLNGVITVLLKNSSDSPSQ